MSLHGEEADGGITRQGCG